MYFNNSGCHMSPMEPETGAANKRKVRPAMGTLDSDLLLIYACSQDSMVMLWEIGGGKGVCHELNGHTDKVQGLSYRADINKLISVCCCFPPSTCILLSCTNVGWPGRRFYCLGSGRYPNIENFIFKFLIVRNWSTPLKVTSNTSTMKTFF